MNLNDKPALLLSTTAELTCPKCRYSSEENIPQNPDWFFIAAGPATSSSSPWLVIAVSSVPLVPGSVMVFRIKTEGSEFSW